MRWRTSFPLAWPSTALDGFCLGFRAAWSGCRVRDFEVVDIFPFGVAFDWEKDGEPTSTVLFERNCAIPSAKVLTFHRFRFQLPRDLASHLVEFCD